MTHTVDPKWRGGAGPSSSPRDCWGGVQAHNGKKVICGLARARIITNNQRSALTHFIRFYIVYSLIIRIQVTIIRFPYS